MDIVPILNHPPTQIWINPYIFFEPFPLCDVMVRIIPRMMDSAVKLFEKDVSSVFANKRVFKTRLFISQQTAACSPHQIPSSYLTIDNVTDYIAQIKDII